MEVAETACWECRKHLVWKILENQPNLQHWHLHTFLPVRTLKAPASKL